jgi:membrane protease YdiL (CAAX protease family)
MNSLASDAPGSPSAEGFAPRAPLASRRHTVIFIAIVLAVTAVSAFNARHGAASDAPASTNHMLQVYLWLIGLEWLWVRFVYKGMQARGRSIREFFGQAWVSPRQLAGDVMYALLAFGFSYAWFVGAPHLLPHDATPANPLLSVVPSGFAAVMAWIVLSLSAGICEEIVFRGYLQRQLTALSGSTTLAILAQAVLFGIAHGYEGFGAVIQIALYGLVIGLLAKWRGNIRAGVLAHAAWDLVAGLALA